MTTPPDRIAALEQERDELREELERRTEAMKRGPFVPGPEPRRYTLAEIEVAARSANEQPGELDLNEWQDAFWRALQDGTKGEKP